MDFQRLGGWLFSEAGAGWVFGLISLGVLLFSALRKRATKIIVRDISTNTLVLVDQRVRQTVKLFFRDTPIYKLSQYDGEITNSGREVIKDATIWVVLNGGQLIDVSVRGGFGEQDASVEHVTADSAKVHIPYLNPFELHRHVVRLSLFADGDFEGLRIAGTGEGWSLERRLVRRHEGMRVLLVLLAVVALFAGEFAYLVYIWPVTGPDAHGGQIWLTDVLYLIPAVVIFGAAMLALRLVEDPSAVDELFTGFRRTKMRDR